jgi:acetyl esterase
MPLDPHLAGLLSLLHGAVAAGARPMSEGDPAAGRAGYRALAASRSPEHVPPVAAVREAEVPGAAGPLAARVYTPPGDGPFPLVAFFHGGGWVIGDLDTHDAMARHVCAGAGAAVVSVAYRLAPEAPFPAAADDAAAAARHLAAHPGWFGGDGRLALAGDSAGGNLAAVTAQELTAAGTPLAAQFLIYPAVDAAGTYPSMAENGAGYFLDAGTVSWFLRHYAAPDPADPRMSPLRGTLAGLPPAVIATAEFDPLRDEGGAYAKALADAGVPVDARCCDGMIHGFFDMDAVSPGAAAFVAERCAAFGRALRAAPLPA